MPLYDYECPQCGATAEIIQPMSAPPHDCPWCGVDMARKLGNIAMYRIQGLGYNSRRKYVKGTAPNTTNTREWTPDNKVPFK